MAERQAPFDALPYAQSCRRIDFDLVEIRDCAENGGRLLLVSGIKPWVDLRVSLEPLVHREPPDYWMIEVVGRLTASGVPGLVDFSVALRLGCIQGFTGIEVVGATRSERRPMWRNQWATASFRRT